MSLLDSLEQTLPSRWLREAETVFALPGMLFLHTLGMGLLVGGCLVLGLRLLQGAPPDQRARLRAFLPVIHAGFCLNLVSGLALLLAYPTKALTNPVFYFKLLAIGVAMLAWMRASRAFTAADGTTPAHGAADGAGAAVSAIARRCAWLAIASGFLAVALGRLLAYTYRYLMARDL